MLLLFYLILVISYGIRAKAPAYYWVAFGLTVLVQLMVSAALGHSAIGIGIGWTLTVIIMGAAFFAMQSYKIPTTASSNTSEDAPHEPEPFLIKSNRNSKGLFEVHKLSIVLIPPHMRTTYRYEFYSSYQTIEEAEAAVLKIKKAENVE